MFGRRWCRWQWFDRLHGISSSNSWQVPEPQQRSGYHFCRCSMLSTVWLQIAKKSWGTKKVPRSWIGKLRKCYLQEDVCYTAFSPKPQFLSSRVLFFFFRKKHPKKTDSAPTKRGVFWPGWWWTYHSRGWELHLQTGFDKSPGCGVTQTARSWRRSLRTAASTRPSERAALANWIHMFLPKVYMIQHQNTSDLVRWYWIYR